MTDEIKTIARRHLASDGANLSLRAVARDLGVVSSAIYRYFASRDDLLTALILDAYNSLGAAVEAADAAGRGRDAAASLRMGRAQRALDGRVPRRAGLGAGGAARVRAHLRQPGARLPGAAGHRRRRRPGRSRVLGGILQDAALRGRFDAGAGASRCPAAGAPRPSPDRRRDLCPDVPPAVVAGGMGAWIQLFGTVSFELFGQLDNAVGDKRRVLRAPDARAGRLHRALKTPVDPVVRRTVNRPPGGSDLDRAAVQRHLLRHQRQPEPGTGAAGDFVNRWNTAVAQSGGTPGAAVLDRDRSRPG